MEGHLEAQTPMNFAPCYLKTPLLDSRVAQYWHDLPELCFKILILRKPLCAHHARHDTVAQLFVAWFVSRWMLLLTHWAPFTTWFVCFTLSASLLWRGTAEVHASFQQFSPHNLLDCARLRCAGNVSETFSADLPSIGLFQLRFDFFPVAVLRSS